MTNASGIKMEQQIAKNCEKINITDYLIFLMLFLRFIPYNTQKNVNFSTIFPRIDIYFVGFFLFITRENAQCVLFGIKSGKVGSIVQGVRNNTNHALCCVIVQALTIVAQMTVS